MNGREEVKECTFKNLNVDTLTREQATQSFNAINYLINEEKDTGLMVAYQAIRVKLLKRLVQLDKWVPMNIL